MRLFPTDTNFNFIGQKKLALTFSLILIVGSIFVITMQGLNFGIDFKGGILIEIRTESKANLVDLRKRLSTLGLGEVSLQEFGSETDVLIRIQDQGSKSAVTVVMDKVKQALGSGIEYRRVEFVGPQVGAELIKVGLMSILFSLAGIMIYVWLRFEWQFGVAALLALIHDVVTTMGVLAITRMEFSLATVAAVLMISGYSINDTVVVFDRVRETIGKYKSKPFEQILNLAINATLSRTLMTSLTTLLALIALWVFGGQVIRPFILALIWGILIGTYSSIFVATPLLTVFKMRKEDVQN